MNNKGFNLFSIIVAAVMLMIGTVLISTLISTEDKTSNEIYIMTNNFNLSDAGALARADAIQSFNYNFRYQIQKWLDFSSPLKITSSGFPILSSDDLRNDPSAQMTIIKENFEGAILFSNTPGDINSFRGVIRLVSENTIQNFEEGRYGKYYVSISDKTNLAVNNTTDAIMSALEASSLTNTPFLNIVGCNGSDCDIGTFYFNIPLDKIDPLTYEKLPKLVVKDMLTNEEMKIGLLPKNNLKIYIPLRFFKAIHHSIDNLRAIKDNEPTFSSAKLGFCDDGCNPRQDPLRTSPSQDRAGATCSENQTTTSYLGQNAYSPVTGTPGSIILQAFVNDTVCRSYTQTSTLSPNFENNNNTLISSTPGIDAIIGCPYYRIFANFHGRGLGRLDGSGEILRCTVITSVYADVIFKETNPTYIVEGDSILYKLRINSIALNPTLSPVVNFECESSQANPGGASTDFCKVK